MPVAKLKILIVEDDEFIGFVYKEKFSSKLYDVSLVTDGEDAIKKASEEVFDLILLDVMLPRKNGWEILEFIRKTLGLKTPIVILSNLAQDSDKAKAKELGASDYLVKSEMGIDNLVLQVLSLIQKQTKA